MQVDVTSIPTVELVKFDHSEDFAGKLSAKSEDRV